ncbi:MAG: hypothetical protein HWD59_01930 [Coxiellaceae bacterium]|nr:MAG: hypothetical protein HWD59_01930 [Coxiellaceae bacterium]
MPTKSGLLDICEIIGALYQNPRYIQTFLENPTAPQPKFDPILLNQHRLKDLFHWSMAIDETLPKQFQPNYYTFTGKTKRYGKIATALATPLLLIYFIFHQLKLTTLAQFFLFLYIVSSGYVAYKKLQQQKFLTFCLKMPLFLSKTSLMISSIST